MIAKARGTFVALGGIGALALLALAPRLTAQDTADNVRLAIRWVDTTPPENSLISVRIFVALHNGVDLVEYGHPASDFVATWVPQDLIPIAQMIEEFNQQYSPAKAGWIWNPLNNGIAHPGPPPPPGAVVVDADPTHHRFLSYLFRLSPSNDAFVANEDPFQIEVFDAEGRFRGPLYVDVYGNQVLDAGLCGNDEARLTGLDIPTFGEQLCNESEGEVSLHPGLNGSFRNPDGVPQRILGGATAYYPPDDSSYREYDVIDADFSRPGYKLGRLIVERRAAGGNWTGSWYSPERSGEGFNVEILEPEPGSPRQRMLVYWYTYEPGDSGRQVWLTGIGEMDTDGGVAATVPLHVTEGGRFAATTNPDTVTRTFWGNIRIGFGSCNEGRVFYEPADPDWPAGDYFITRLSPQIEGLGWVCREDDARLVLPAD